MLIPEINPDEFGPGLLIRLGLINGLRSHKKTIEALHLRNSNADIPSGLIPAHLARCLDMNIEQFCQQHTLLPIHRSITNTSPDIIHGSMQYPYGIKRFGLFGYAKHLKICKACIDEDMKYHGYSYYRRSHQLPGAQVCSKHFKCIEGALRSTPSGLFLNPDMVQDQLLSRKKIFQNPVIDRFQEILEGLCHFRSPILTTRIIDQLQKKAREKNLRWTNTGSRTLFSDFLLEQFPYEWLIEVIPSFRTKIIGKRHSSTDGALSPQEKTSISLIYILMLTLLYNDSDQALNMLKSSKSLKERRIKSAERLAAGYLETLDYKKLYIEHNGRATKISSQVKVNPSVIRLNLKKEGIPSLGKIRLKTINGFLLFVRGTSLPEAARISGATLVELEDFIRGGCSKLYGMIETLQAQQVE